MNNIELVEKIATLQILIIRYAERHTALRFKTYRDIDLVLTGGKLTSYYKDGVKNLYNFIKKSANNDFFLNEISDIKNLIIENGIGDLRFGLQPQRKFSELESELECTMTKTLVRMNILCSIKDASEILNIPVTTIKQACQQERLLNTQKNGNTWLVSIDECRKYWAK